MDKLIVDRDGKKIEIDIPKYGIIKVVIQEGKVVRADKTESQKFD